MLSHVFNGEDYITFDVAKLKTPDSFGHGYTAYVNKKVETPEPHASLVEDAPQKSTRKPKRTATPKTEASDKSLPMVVRFAKAKNTP